MGPRVAGGKSSITHIAAAQSTGELIGTFMIHQYKKNSEGELVVDALVISASQKLSLDWRQFAAESALLMSIGFLINPAFGVKEFALILIEAGYVVASYSDAKSTQTDLNAKAILVKALMDKDFVIIEDHRLYLILK